VNAPKCGCGTPSLAAFHTTLIVGRDIPGGTDTTECDFYTCDVHTYDEEDHAEEFVKNASPGWYVIETEQRSINHTCPDCDAPVSAKGRYCNRCD
jgi:hypothetical protein